MISQSKYVPKPKPKLQCPVVCGKQGKGERKRHKKTCEESQCRAWEKGQTEMAQVEMHIARKAASVSLSLGNRTMVSNTVSNSELLVSNSY